MDCNSLQRFGKRNESCGDWIVHFLFLCHRELVAASQQRLDRVGAQLGGAVVATAQWH
jgi:hypothetical protein